MNRPLYLAVIGDGYGYVLDAWPEEIARYVQECRPARAYPFTDRRAAEECVAATLKDAAADASSATPSDKPPA